MFADRRKGDRVMAVLLIAVLSLGTPRSKVYIQSATKDTSTSNRTQKFVKMFTTASHYVPCRPSSNPFLISIKIRFNTINKTARKPSL